MVVLRLSMMRTLNASIGITGVIMETVMRREDITKIARCILKKMHQAIIGAAPKGYVIDHINGNKLDNRRSNLRFVTHQQNTFNSKPKTNVSGRLCRSRFKGVTWRGDRHKWRSCITIDRKRHYIGLYDTEEEAAIAYNNAAIILFGEYANLNDI